MGIVWPKPSETYRRRHGGQRPFAPWRRMRSEILAARSCGSPLLRECRQEAIWRTLCGLSFLRSLCLRRRVAGIHPQFTGRTETSRSTSNRSVKRPCPATWRNYTHGLGSGCQARIVAAQISATETLVARSLRQPEGASHHRSKRACRHPVTARQVHPMSSEIASRDVASCCAPRELHSMSTTLYHRGAWQVRSAPRCARLGPVAYAGISTPLFVPRA